MQDTADLLLKGSPAVPLRLIHQQIDSLDSDNYTNTFNGTIIVTTLDIGVIGVIPLGLVRMGTSGGLTIWVDQIETEIGGYASWRGSFILPPGQTITVFNDLVVNISAHVCGWLLNTPPLGV